MPRVVPPSPAPGYGLKEDLARDLPKLSVRVSEALEHRLQQYLADHPRSMRPTIQQLITEALDWRLAQPIPVPAPRPGDAYRGGNMLSWQEADDAQPGQGEGRRR